MEALEKLFTASAATETQSSFSKTKWSLSHTQVFTFSSGCMAVNGRKRLTSLMHFINLVMMEKTS